MVYGAAIEYLKDLRCPEGQDDVVRIIYNGDLRDQAIEEAIEALEKQIPKKPEIRMVKPPVYEPEERWCCPTCGNVVEVDDNEYYRTELYPACECGQRIDWSDVLDEYHMKWKRYEVE